MSIENLLNKIILNYKKKKLSLTITPDLILQDASGNHEISSIDSVESHSSVNSLHPHPLNSQDQIPYDSSGSIKHQIIQSPKISSDPFAQISTKEADINIIEWRSYRRKNISIPIDFTSVNRLYKEMTKNISASGLFIQTQKYNKLARNQTIMMVFKIIENQKPFKLTGKVIRVEPEGIAVQFHNISDFDCAAMEEALSNLS